MGDYGHSIHILDSITYMLAAINFETIWAFILRHASHLKQCISCNQRVSPSHYPLNSFIFFIYFISRLYRQDERTTKYFPFLATKEALSFFL